MVNKLIIDFTQNTSDLCILGATHATDKSPYSKGSASGHCHAYTGVYDLLFGPRRYQHLTVGEIGIEWNSSMKMWRDYFPNANLIGWEFYPSKIENALKDELLFTKYYSMDVTSVESIQRGFSAHGRTLDVLIEDSTHQFEDQVRVMSIAHTWLNPGGYLVIEDIFKSRSEKDYADALIPYSQYYDSVFFVEPQHSLQYSGDWQNDKLLIMRRGNL